MKQNKVISGQVFFVKTDHACLLIHVIIRHSRGDNFVMQCWRGFDVNDIVFIAFQVLCLSNLEL